MIRPLRTRHRWMILSMAFATGVLMVLGLLARRPVPTVDTLPAVGFTHDAEASAPVVVFAASGESPAAVGAVEP